MELLNPKWDNLNQLFDKESEMIYISSPWWSASGIATLKPYILKSISTSTKRIEFWFRMNITEYLLGLTDYEGLAALIYQIQDGIGIECIHLYISDNLHAKFYATDQRLLVASSNLTQGGFENNIELGVSTRWSNTIQENFKKILEMQHHKLKKTNLMELDAFLVKLKTSKCLEYKNKIEDILFEINHISISNKFRPHHDNPFR